MNARPLMRRMPCELFHYLVTKSTTQNSSFSQPFYEDSAIIGTSDGQLTKKF